MVRTFALDQFGRGTAALFLGLFALFFVAPAGAQDQKRVALVIGNSAYQHAGILANPANDAALISQVLRQRGFEVQQHSDLGFRQMLRAFSAYTTRLAQLGPEAVGLIFYAGHGMQVNGLNFMIPVDARIEKEADIPVEAVSATSLMESVAQIGNKLNIVVLDACRNNPYRAFFRSGGTGLARMDAPVGSLVAFSTAPGRVAADGTGVNSPYSRALAQAILAPGLKIEDVFKRVRNEVYQETSGQQVPWESSSVFGEFYFAGAPKTAAGGQPAATAPDALAWQSIRDTRSAAVLEAFVKRFPDSVFAAFARARIGELTGTPVQVASAAPVQPGLRPAPDLGNRFRAVRVQGGKPISGDVRWEIFQYEASRGGGRGRRVNYSNESEPAIALPKGDYLVVVKYGNATVQGRVSVAPDKPYGHVFVLNAGTVKMIPRLAAGSPVLDGRMRWDVFSAETDDRGRRQQITYATDTTPRFDLAAGRYYVQATYGAAMHGRIVEVTPGPERSEELILDAGPLKLRMTMAAGVKDLDRNVRWDVFKAEANDEGQRQHVTYSTQPFPTFHLSAGRYRVVAQHEVASLARELEIAAGKETVERFVLNAGRLGLTASLQPGGPALKRGLRFDVFAAEPDLDGKRRHVTYATRPDPKFALTEGRYIVEVSQDAARTSAEVTVSAGKFVSEDINLDAGYLALSTVLAEGGKPLRRDLRYDVYAAELDAAGQRRHVTYSVRPDPRFTLRSGRYHVVAQIGGVARHSADLEVRAGEDNTRTLVADAGQVKLVATEADGGRFRRRVRWDLFVTVRELLEVRRNHVTYSTSREPIIFLNAGEYVVVATTDQGTSEHTIRIAPGEAREHRLAVK